MRILIPWKPVVLVWGLLSGMIFFGFVASSVLQGKDPFEPGATITQTSDSKTGAARIYLSSLFGRVPRSLPSPIFSPAFA